MKINKLFFWVPVFCLFGALKTAAQPISSAEIDQLVERTMKTFQVPGMAVAVIKDGKVIHEKGYGVRAMNSDEKIDKYTNFAIASNSKAFTGAALGILVDDGKIKWDDRVIDYIPEFRLYSPFVTEEFTIRDLLTHRSGLGLGAGDLMIFPDSNDFTIEELIHNMRYLKPVSSFRSKYDYDNLLYIVAGEVVKRACGTSWYDFIEERIMKPLGMTRSASDYTRLKDRVNVVTPHAVIGDSLQIIDRYRQKIVSAAGGIYSNIDDLSKWIIMQLGRGKYGADAEKQLLSPAVHGETWRPQTIVGGFSGGTYNTHFTAYALGFMVSDVKGQYQVTHTGGVPGIWTQITMLPESNVGIIVLTNQQSSYAFSSVTNQIKDSYLGVTGTDRVAENEKAMQGSLAHARKVTDEVWKDVADQQRQNAGKEPDFTPFLGKYKDPWFGEVDIVKKDDGQLWFVSKRSPKMSGPMYPYKGNTLVIKWTDRTMEADAFIRFELDFEGNASGFKMQAVSPLTDFSWDYQDLDFTKL